MNWYPKRDVEWYPDKPTVGQVAFGAVFFLALAALLLYWLFAMNRGDGAAP